MSSKVCVENKCWSINIPQFDLRNVTLNNIGAPEDTVQILQSFLDSQQDFCRLCLSANNVTRKMFQEIPGDLSMEFKIYTALDVKLKFCDTLPNVICEECAKTADTIQYFTSWLENLKKQYSQVQVFLQGLINSNNLKKKLSLIVHFQPIITRLTPTVDAVGKEPNKSLFIEKELPTSLYDPGNPERVSFSTAKDHGSCLTMIKTSEIDDWKELETGSIEDVDQSEDTCEKFICKCGKYFTRLSTFNRHMSTHSSQVFQCPECDSQFKRKEYLLKHLVMSHKDVKEKYQCHMCNRRFISCGLLDKHIRAHMGMKPYKCEICEQYFSQKNLLQSHLNWHNGTKGHLCEFCGQAFFSSQNLKVHILEVHFPSKLWKFKCSICDKMFKRKNHLQDHMLVHNNNRPHQCKICGISYKRLSQLTEHKYIHGEKLFKCDKCEKSFTSKRFLVAHKVLHPNLKIHKCTECDKTFARRNGLTSHLESHAKKTKSLICSSSGC